MEELKRRVEEYDLLVLGSGEGGKYLAWTFAKRGARVAVVERRWIGGSCPNIACLPTKNVIHSAKVASLASRGAEFGLRGSAGEVDLGAVLDRKRRMVEGLVETHLKNYQASGAELVIGSGRFVEERTIEVSLADGGTRVLRGKDVILDTGSRARIEPIPGLQEAEPLTHIEALELKTLPDHLLVLGGGFVGLELSQAYRRLGAKVTILERGPRLASREDADVSDALRQIFQEEGVEVRTGVTLLGVEGKSGEGVRVRLGGTGGETILEGSHLLVAMGRRPNTDGIGLDLAGVETTEKGYVKVDEGLRTTAPGVWAVGDCAGSPHFTHISFDDFRIVRDNLLGGQRVTTGRQVPFCVFTDPEFARLGLSETEAKERGVPYRLARLPMASVLRAKTLAETRGFMKALVDPEKGHILGFAALGVDAGEVLSVVQVAMLAGLPYTALRDANFTHPTLAEGLIPLFSSLS